MSVPRLQATATLLCYRLLQANPKLYQTHSFKFNYSLCTTALDKLFVARYGGNIPNYMVCSLFQSTVSESEVGIVYRLTESGAYITYITKKKKMTFLLDVYFSYIEALHLKVFSKGYNFH